jgi:phospholipid/cholesterol/gamma-HCH transport system substrate-binding protein
MMRRGLATAVKFAAFAAVMSMLTASLFFVFGQYRTSSTAEYSAVFADVSQLRPGDSVRVAGIRIGTVTDVSLRADNKVAVRFDADDEVVVTDGTKLAVRYLNLVGDRYLELLDGPGSTRRLAPGAEVAEANTAPALDLDLLLGGLKPVVQGLNPADVNQLTSALLAVFQGQGGTLESVFSKTSSFANALADNNDVVQRMIDNLNTVVTTLNEHGDKFSGAIDRLEQLTRELSQERDPVAAAIDSLDAGTASLADLLTTSRPPLAATVIQLNRLAPLLDEDKDRIDAALRKAPENYRKLVRLGAYGNFIQFYVCGLSLRVSDLQNRTAVFPWIKQEGGRCSEPDA